MASAYPPVPTSPVTSAATTTSATREPPAREERGRPPATPAASTIQQTQANDSADVTRRVNVHAAVTATSERERTRR